MTSRGYDIEAFLSPHGHDAFLKEWEQMNDALNVMKEYKYYGS